MGTVDNTSKQKLEGISGVAAPDWLAAGAAGLAAGPAPLYRAIPGTTKVQRLEENAGSVDVELTPDDLQEITDAADRVEVQGERYPEHMQRWIDR